MIKVSQSESIHWIEFINLVREYLGDENLILTFMPFKNRKNRKKYFSTFGSDNIEHFIFWASLMNAKFVSGTIDLIPIVIRVFLKDEISGVWSNGKAFTIPKKDIYHMAVTNNDLQFYDDYETYIAQNTNSADKTPLEEEPGVTCKSSIDLFNILIDKSLNL